MKLKRLFHSVWALGFVACSDSPIAPPPPPPPPIPPTLSVTTNEVGPESALVHASANTAVAWRVFWGSTLAFGDTTPETSPSPELNQTLRGLRALTTYYYQVEARLDSELLVRQFNNEYRINDVDLKPLYVDVHNLVMDFKKVTFVHIPREKNKEADRMVNKILDERG